MPRPRTLCECCNGTGRWEADPYNFGASGRCGSCDGAGSWEETTCDMCDSTEWMQLGRERLCVACSEPVAFTQAVRVPGMGWAIIDADERRAA